MSTQSKGLLARLAQGSLVKQILVGLVLGILLAMVSKPAAEATGLLGTLFVGALKAVAPVLVLMLVMASIANHQHGQKTNIRPILFLYLLGTFSAALTAVVFSFLFPSTLHLTSAAGDITPPSGIVEVLRGLLMSMVSNPITALMNGNYIGILVWAIGLGFALRHGNETTKNLVNDLSNAVTFMVKLVIRFAPVGIFGLVSSTLATTGFDALWGYRAAAGRPGRLYAAGGAGDQPAAGVLADPPQPVSAGADLPARERRVCLLHPQLSGEHTGEHGAGGEAEPGPRYLFGVDSPGCNREHGRCGDYHHRADAGGGAYAGYSGRSANRAAAERRCIAVCLWRIRRGGRLSAADPAGL